MRTFRMPNVTPPSGFKYVVPETGMEVLAGGMDNLVVSVQRHYAVNKLPIPKNLRAVIEHYLCLINPETFCRGEYEPGDQQTVNITTSAIKEATNYASARLKWGPDKFLCSQAEADRRASICVSCPENYRGICTTCNGLKDYVVKAIGDRVTAYDSRLGVCSRCSCLVKAKVHISMPAIRAVTPPADFDKYPANCWMHEGV